MTIVSKESIREKARRDFAAGKARDEHGFNWHAPALQVWLAEYDRLEGEAQKAEHEALATC